MQHSKAIAIPMEVDLVPYIRTMFAAAFTTMVLFGLLLAFFSS